MANTILTPNIIAKEALMRLKNNLVLANLVNRSYSSEFVKGVGETITVPVPATFVAQEYNGTLQYQDITQGQIQITLSKILDISFKVTSKELTLDIANFGDLYLEGATLAFAQKIDETLAELYKDVPYYVDVSATPSVSDLIKINEVMNINKVPVDDKRRLVLDPTTQSKYIGLDAFLYADRSGSTDALREASMGRAFTLDTYMDQNIRTHVKGTLSGATATGSIGATTVAITGTGTLNKGDIITFAGVSGSYVVKDNYTVGTNTAVSIYPALSQNVSGATVTVHNSHIANLAFHQNAFVLASATLEPPLDGRTASVVRDPNSGLAIRVVYGYDIEAKTNVVSMDMLIGVKTLMPELAVRLCG